MKITITGTANLRVPYAITLDMSEDQFDDLTWRQQKEVIEGRIDWLEACRQAEVDSIDIDDVKEIGINKNDNKNN